MTMIESYAFLFLLVVCQAICPDGWIHFENDCYILGTQKVRWYEAAVENNMNTFLEDHRRQPQNEMFSLCLRPDECFPPELHNLTPFLLKARAACQPGGHIAVFCTELSTSSRSYTYLPNYTSSSGKNKTFKIAVLGAPAVGKSAITTQLLEKRFLRGYSATIQDRYITNFDVDGREVVLDIFDTPGAYCFANVRRLAIINADAFVLVYDIGDESSFEKLVEMRDLIVSEKKDGVPIVVVGNKTDKDINRFMSKGKTNCLATAGWQHRYMEASAKDNASILDIFQEIVILTRVFLKQNTRRRMTNHAAMLQSLRRRFKRTQTVS